MEQGLVEYYNRWLISISGQRGRYFYTAQKDGLYLSNTISAIDEQQAMDAVKMVVDNL